MDWCCEACKEHTRASTKKADPRHHKWMAMKLGVLQEGLSYDLVDIAPVDDGEKTGLCHKVQATFSYVASSKLLLQICRSSSRGASHAGTGFAVRSRGTSWQRIVLVCGRVCCVLTSRFGA